VGGEPTRTCNVTSLAMALEGLGKGAADYTGNRENVIAIAKEFKGDVAKADLVADKGKGDYGAVSALRLSDFLELAAIAKVMEQSGAKPDSAGIMGAARTAWDKILELDFLAQLARQFSASPEIKYFSFDGTGHHTVKRKGKDVSVVGTEEGDALGGASLDARHKMDKLIDDRTKLNAATNPKKKAALQAEYDADKKADAHLLSNKSIEASVPIEKYKQAVISQIGNELATGAAVETHVTNHFVRVHAVFDDHVVIDDPAQPGRAHKVVLWEEARAEGLFAKRLVLR
jgi:hypothetical protein